MKLIKIASSKSTHRVGILDGGDVRLLDISRSDTYPDLASILHADDPAAVAESLIDPDAGELLVESVRLLAPIDRQEVWAAGVTYQRSQAARMEESESGASHYDKVYTADRPELFLKATADRVVGPGQPLRVRSDSNWSVPEPEFTLMISPDLRLVGFTIGNDVSARDIEGENPLYLPQAKVYNQSCAIGPCVLVPDAPLDLPNTRIELTILRADSEVFKGDTNLGQLARTFEDLISWLGREYDFPHGAALLTGTGVVPPDDFTLEDGDVVSIEVTGVGVLTNPVVKNG